MSVTSLWGINTIIDEHAGYNGIQHCGAPVIGISWLKMQVLLPHQ